MRKKKTSKGRKSKKASAPSKAIADNTPPAPVTEVAPSSNRPSRKRACISRGYPWSAQDQAEYDEFLQHYRVGQASTSEEYSDSDLTISYRKPVKKNAPGRRGRPTAASKAGRVAEGIDGALKRMIEIQKKLGALQAEYLRLRGNL